MPVPFRKIFKRPGLRRIVLPFTAALVLLGFAALILVGT